jgi:DNA helicase-2/ATP-dependent DNA helicase PcrA
LRDLRDASVPLGTALADLELQLDAQALDEGELLDLSGDDIDARAIVLDRQADDRAALAAVIRMGRDYLRLDPVGRADTFSSWLTATVQSEGDHPGSRDAVDVATFHAAKGLEWTTVHLAGVEDGYVPIAHAKTAAARAEEVRLLYVAMTRAQRHLRISWAEHRTFSGRVVDRRRSPLLDPLVQQAALRPVPAEPATITPPVEDWSEEVARQRAVLQATRRTIAPELEALRRWRDGAARAARIDPEAVLPDHVLSRVVAARPRDVDALGAVRGVGPILASRFGAAMLDALASPAEAGGGER